MDNPNKTATENDGKRPRNSPLELWGFWEVPTARFPAAPQKCCSHHPAEGVETHGETVVVLAPKK